MAKTVNVEYPISKVGKVKINTSKKCHKSNYDVFKSREIKYIVMHYTGNPKDAAAGNANYFTGANRNVSAHFFVDDDSIWQSVGLKDVAWHAGAYDKNSFAYHAECRNVNSIGIEMCCTAGNYDMSAQTVELSAQLCAALCKYLGITDVDKYVLRHYDVIHKDCPRPMVQNTARWTAFKKRVKEILKESEPKAEKDTFVKVELRQLKKGMSGDDCQMLKVLLKAKGYLKIDPMANKKFGDKTEQAVIAFKKKNGLSANGIVAEKTWAKLLSK